MPRLPELFPAIVSDINDEDIIVGEDIKGTGKTFKYTFKVLKEYFGASGGSGVTSIITKSDDVLTGPVKLYTGELHITSNFNFVTDADLAILERFSITTDRLNLLDEAGVVIQYIDNDAVGFNKPLELNDVAAGDSETMQVLVIDPATNIVKKTPVHELIELYEVSQVGIGILVSLGSPIALVDAGYVLADATDATKVCIGFVKSITDDDNIIYQESGELDVFTGLTVGATYYLNTTAGTLINVEPPNFKQPLGLALSATKLLIRVSPLHLTGDIVPLATVQSFIKVVTNNYVILSTDDTILADGSTTAVRVSLESTPPQGREVRIKCVDDTNVCDIEPNGKLIDGSAAILVVAIGTTVTLKYDATYGWAKL